MASRSANGMLSGPTATDAPNQVPRRKRSGFDPAGSSTDPSSRGMSGAGVRREFFTNRALA